MDCQSEILLNGFCKEFGLDPGTVLTMKHTGLWTERGPEVEVLFRDGHRCWCMPGPRVLPTSLREAQMHEP